MPTKRTTDTGLGRPDVKGVEGLFEVVTNEPEPAATVIAEKDHQPVTSPTPETDQPERVKTSVSLAPETLDLLQDLKRAARKREKRFISVSELMDRAVRDLAEKMGVAANQ